MKGQTRGESPRAGGRQGYQGSPAAVPGIDGGARAQFSTGGMRGGGFRTCLTGAGNRGAGGSQTCHVQSQKPITRQGQRRGHDEARMSPCTGGLRKCQKGTSMNFLEKERLREKWIL